MSKHTPGPWKVRTLSYPPDILDKNGETIVGVYETQNTDEQDANASLIAAAPELLKACKKAIEHYAISAMMGDEVDAEIAKTLRAAIKKAEGA